MNSQLQIPFSDGIFEIVKLSHAVSDLTRENQELKKRFECINKSRAAYKGWSKKRKKK